MLGSPFTSICRNIKYFGNKKEIQRKLFNATSAELPFPWYSANKKLDVGIMETRRKYNM